MPAEPARILQLLVERLVVRLGGLEIRLRVQRIGSPAGEVRRVKAKTLPDAAAAGGVEIPAN